MTADQLSRPVLGAFAIAGILALAGGAAAPERRADPPSQPSAPGAALLTDLDRLHTRVRAHAAYYAGREGWLNVGVHPLPKPRAWKAASR